MKQNAGRKLLSSLPTLAMVLVLLPGTALAGSGTRHNHDGIAFTDWTGNTSLPDTAYG